MLFLGIPYTVKIYRGKHLQILHFMKIKKKYIYIHIYIYIFVYIYIYILKQVNAPWTCMKGIKIKATINERRDRTFRCLLTTSSACELEC